MMMSAGLPSRNAAGVLLRFAGHNSFQGRQRVLRDARLEDHQPFQWLLIGY
ncbi:hypothetical protein G6M16_021305 [Agrobacterium tumefaciens]|nr:hypothetical protein G6M16_021305 [Agrobacterium tumefaciens]